VSVVVVGGGIVGLAIAWRAGQAGLGVTVIDADPGGGASHAAAGMLAPVSEVHYGEEALLSLNRASLARWPGFAAELAAAGGVAVPLRRAGSLLVAFDEDDLRVLDELHAFQTGLGLAVARLGRRDCRRLEPMLSPRIRGGVLVAEEANVDGRAVCTALLAAIDRVGGRVVREGVEEVLVEGERVVGVRLASGPRVDAEWVVLAAGARSGSVLGVPPCARPPVRPVKGQILRLRFDPAAPPLCHNVRALVRGASVYLVPRDNGELVVGATVEEQGFDVSATAGGVHDLLRAAIEVVPMVAELELVEAIARSRPGTPDNAPVIGPTALDGLILATGHHRNGVLLAPITADAVTAILLGGEPSPELASFDIGRFQP
jgi:glycine oxidase